MKTISKTMLAAMFTLVGSAVMAQAPYGTPYSKAPIGNCPGGVCNLNTSSGCANGSCGIAGCPDGQCGPMGCPNGACAVGTAPRYTTPSRTQSAAVGYGARPVRPVSGYMPAAACPNGNCARTSVVNHTVGYRPTAVGTGNCPNGQCNAAPVPRYPTAQVPRHSVLGLRW